MTPQPVRERIKVHLQEVELQKGKFDSVTQVKDYFGIHWSKAAYDSTLEYFAERQQRAIGVRTAKPVKIELKQKKATERERILLASRMRKLSSSERRKLAKLNRKLKRERFRAKRK